MYGYNLNFRTILIYFCIVGFIPIGVKGWTSTGNWEFSDKNKTIWHLTQFPVWINIISRERSEWLILSSYQIYNKLLTVYECEVKMKWSPQLWLCQGCLIVSLIGGILADLGNPYQILGVHRRASQKEIRKAYMQLVKEWWIV